MSILLYVLVVIRLVAGPVTPPDCSVNSDSVKRQGRTSYVHNNGSSSTEISYEGTITFTDDERDIKSISPGGFFRYSKTTFGNRREILIQSNSEGNLKRKYYVGRQEEPFEPEGRKWLEEMLPEVIATSGIGAEDRVRRIYAKSGVNGVLSQISKLESDYVQSIYYNFLLNQATLKDNDLLGILTHLKSNVSSDYEMSKLLQRVAPRYLQNEKVVSAYLGSISTMTSDYEKSRVLKSILKSKLSQANFNLVMGTVAKITSDYEKANVLRTILANQSLTDKTHKDVLAQLTHVTSDYERYRVLHDCVNNTRFVGENFNEIVLAINKITSDYEKSRALSYLLTKYKFTPQNYLQVFPVVASLTSSYEKSQVLNLIKKQMPQDNAQIKSAYLKTAKTITSDYEYRRVVDNID